MTITCYLEARKMLETDINVLIASVNYYWLAVTSKQTHSWYEIKAMNMPVWHVVEIDLHSHASGNSSNMLYFSSSVPSSKVNTDKKVN